MKIKIGIILSIFLIIFFVDENFSISSIRYTIKGTMNTVIHDSRYQKNDITNPGDNKMDMTNEVTVELKAYDNRSISRAFRILKNPH